MKTLPKHERDAFVKKIRDSANGEQMSEIIKETYKASYFESETSKGNRRYLPLTVWAKKGFDEKRIEQNDDKK